jgi:DNA anti-recombination protein RmuC
LIAALKLVADLWKREYQSRHAIEIAETGGALYDKFVGFVGALGEIETHLGRAQKSHANAMNLLRDGNGNLIRRVEKLKKLGAKAKKTLPSSLLTDMSVDDEPDESRLEQESLDAEPPDSGTLGLNVDVLRRCDASGWEHSSATSVTGVS